MAYVLLVDFYTISRLIVLTDANDEQFKEYNLARSPYEIFTLKHDPEKTDPAYYNKLLNHYGFRVEDVIYFEHNVAAVKSAVSVGIKTYFYDHTKADLGALKQFIDVNLTDG